MVHTTLTQMPIQVIVHAMMFVVVLSVRDAITRTLELIPFPQDNVWWRWAIAILHIFIAFVILAILMKGKWMRMEFVPI